MGWFKSALAPPFMPMRCVALAADMFLQDIDYLRSILSQNGYGRLDYCLLSLQNNVLLFGWVIFRWQIVGRTRVRTTYLYWMYVSYKAPCAERSIYGGMFLWALAGALLVSILCLVGRRITFTLNFFCTSDGNYTMSKAQISIIFLFSTSKQHVFAINGGAEKPMGVA